MITNHFYKHHLRTNEKVLLVTEKHFITRLIIHLLVVLTAISIYIVLLFLASFERKLLLTDFITLATLLVIIVIMYLILWRVLLVRRGVIFTNYRIIHFDNTLFTRSIKSIFYNRITKYEFNNTILGEIFNYGNLYITVYEANKDIYFLKYKNINEAESIINNFVDIKLDKSRD